MDCQLAQDSESDMGGGAAAAAPPTVNGRGNNFVEFGTRWCMAESGVDRTCNARMDGGTAWLLRLFGSCVDAVV